MTGPQLGALGVIVAILTGIGSVIFMAIQSSRAADQARKEERREAVAEAVAPLRRELEQASKDLASMERDRDYWRERAGNNENRSPNRPEGT